MIFLSALFRTGFLKIKFHIAVYLPYIYYNKSRESNPMKESKTINRVQ